MVGVGGGGGERERTAESTRTAGGLNMLSFATLRFEQQVDNCKKINTTACVGVGVGVSVCFPKTSPFSKEPTLKLFSGRCGLLQIHVTADDKRNKEDEVSNNKQWGKKEPLLHQPQLQQEQEQQQSQPK